MVETLHRETEPHPEKCAHVSAPPTPLSNRNQTPLAARLGAGVATDSSKQLTPLIAGLFRDVLCCQPRRPRTGEGDVDNIARDCAPDDSLAVPFGDERVVAERLGEGD